jgi:hypothetical protein
MDPVLYFDTLDPADSSPFHITFRPPFYSASSLIWSALLYVYLYYCTLRRMALPVHLYFYTMDGIISGVGGLRTFFGTHARRSRTR